jgi:site-specific DNA-methyltransferase (adenine-specific)
VLPRLGKVDHIISDPPYGDADTHSGHLAQVVLRDGSPAGQELGFRGIDETQCVAMARAWCEAAARWVVFTCEWKFMKALDDAGLLIRFGIWRKPDGAPQFTGDRPGTGWEAVAICHRRGRKVWNGGGRHAFWSYPKGQNTSGHPTGKPLELFRDFVEAFTDADDLVLDPYCGSGTTGVACIRTGRRFTGVELEERYCEIAVRRMERELAARPLPGMEPEAEREDVQPELFAEVGT